MNELLFVGPQMFCGDLASCVSRLGISPDRLVTETTDKGYAIGASTGAAISSRWDQLKGGQQVVVIHAGDGLWSGSILLASE
jgi:3-oxoacyl-[acyl-carrier-protein] synthase III